MRRLCAVALLGVALAAIQAVAANEPGTLRVAFNIPAQPMPDALDELATQAGVQILHRDPASGKEPTTQRVNGTLTLKEALDRLLLDTGYRYELVNGKTVRVWAAEAPVAAKTHQDTSAEPDRPLALAQSHPRENKAVVTSDSGIDVSQRTEAKGTGVAEVIVTAQKRAERLQDVPISISVVSGAELDKSSAVSVTEVLNRVPGVVASEASQGGGTRVAMRGVGSSFPLFSGSSPIGYYLDSVPFGLVKTAIAPDQSAYDLQRIEVLRGPQGTLYGASAENGLVRILASDANLDRFELKARTTYSATQGGGDNYRGDLAVNVPLLPGKLAVRGVLGYSNLGGWVDSPNRREVNDAALHNYRIKINGQPTDEFSVGLSAWRSQNEYGAPSFSDQNGRIPTIQDQSISTDYDTYGLKLEYRWPQVVLSSMTSYLDYDNKSNLGLNFSGSPGLALFTGLGARVFSQEVLLNSDTQGAWRWSSGIFYRDAEDRLRQNNLGGGAPFDYGNSSNSYAVFGELSRRFHGGQFEWTLGARYFHDDVRVKENINQGPPGSLPQDNRDTFHATTPRVVLSWYPSSDVTLYTSYSEGFRSGFDQDPGVLRSNPGFPPLKPDKLRNYEIGSKAVLFDRRFSIDNAVYFIDWKDVQQTLSVPFNGTFVSASVNGKSASGFGADLGLTLRPIDNFDVGLSGSWNDLTVDSAILSGGVVLFNEGDRLNLSPKYTVGGFIDYAFALGRGGFTGRFSASGNYTSPMYSRIITGPANARFSRISRGDPIATSRVSFSIEAPSHWTATAFVDNANDERGAVIGNAAVPSWATRVRPRTTGVQAEYRF